MAGSGKTTFLQRVNSYLHSVNKPPYILNLDPAVTHLPFTANIDIRDTVDYQEVMKQSVSFYRCDTTYLRVSRPTDTISDQTVESLPL